MLRLIPQAHRANRRGRLAFNRDDGTIRVGTGTSGGPVQRGYEPSEDRAEVGVGVSVVQKVAAAQE